MDENQKPAPSSPEAERKARERARLDAALRDNLRRRKAQARGRANPAGAADKGQT